MPSANAMNMLINASLGTVHISSYSREVLQIKEKQVTTTLKAEMKMLEREREMELLKTEMKAGGNIHLLCYVEQPNSF
jgi:Tfp pilus assembly protein PilE